MKISEVIKSLPASNAAIKNTASSEPKDGWCPAYSASGQDVWLPGSRYTQKGIVVSAVGARCGKAFKADGEWNICANTHPLSVDETKALRDYCWYMINNEDWWIKGGTAQPFIKVKDSFNRDFNFPSIPVQKLIVKRLDTVRTLIDRKRQQIEKLDELVKARFVEMLGASVDTVPLRDICETASGGTPSTKHPDYYKGTIPWISTTALGPNHISGDSAKAYITEEAIINSATKLIPKGNLLFGIRVGVGKTSINDVDICTNQDIVAITNIDEARFSKLFIKHVLDSNQTYYDSLKKGATILGITSDDLKNTPIPLVSFSRQKLFESFVEQVDKSKFTLSNKLAVCNFYIRLVYDRIMHGRIDL